MAGSGGTKGERLIVRLEASEALAFGEAARLCGLSLSAWVRMVLREAAEYRLASAGATPGWIKG